MYGREGTHIFLTREPTGFEVGRQIKRELKKDNAAGVDPLKEKGAEYAKRYVEDRKEHLELIGQVLEKGIHTISDRHKYSTFVYQGVQGMSFEWLNELHTGMRLPDLVLILDLPVEQAMQRRIGEKSIPEVFEKIDFQRKAREGYLALKEKLESEKIVIVDGSGSILEVHAEIVKEAEKLFGLEK